MTLSRRGWNNVIIFVVLAMMMIFQYSGKKLNENKTPSYQTALPANAVILAMQLENMNIRRVGAELEMTPKSHLSQTQLAKIVKTWETATFKSLPSDIQVENLAYGINISFTLANLAEPVVVILYQIDNGYLIQNWQNQLLQLDESELQVLLPR